MVLYTLSRFKFKKHSIPSRHLRNNVKFNLYISNIMHKATFKYALNQEKLFMNNFEPKQKKMQFI